MTKLVICIFLVAGWLGQTTLDINCKCKYGQLSRYTDFGEHTVTDQPATDYPNCTQ